jgi:hypothetical protein
VTVAVLTGFERERIVAALHNKIQSIVKRYHKYPRASTKVRLTEMYIVKRYIAVQPMFCIGQPLYRVPGRAAQGRAVGRFGNIGGDSRL